MNMRLLLAVLVLAIAGISFFLWNSLSGTSLQTSVLDMTTGDELASDEVISPAYFKNESSSYELVLGPEGEISERQ